MLRHPYLSTSQQIEKRKEGECLNQRRLPPERAIERKPAMPRQDTADDADLATEFDSYLSNMRGIGWTFALQETQHVLAKLHGIHADVRGQTVRLKADPANVHIFKDGVSLLYR